MSRYFSLLRFYGCCGFFAYATKIRDVKNITCNRAVFLGEKTAATAEPQQNYSRKIYKMNLDKIKEQIAAAMESDVVSKASLLVQLAQEYLDEYYKSHPCEEQESPDK